jgi:hypothetical protein
LDILQVNSNKPHSCLSFNYAIDISISLSFLGQDETCSFECSSTTCDTCSTERKIFYFIFKKSKNRLFFFKSHIVVHYMKKMKVVHLFYPVVSIVIIVVFMIHL